jgi:Protein of unknown function (DUF2786)
MPVIRSEAKVMQQIRNLLAKANDSACSPAERESLLRQANLKMSRHAIDQAMLDMNRTSAEKRVPTQMSFKLWDDGSWWGTYFGTVIDSISRTNRCRMFRKWDDTITVVGMQEDCEWVQMLWLNVFMDFSSKVNPSWDVEETRQENIFRFKNAGYKWEQIWALIHRNRPDWIQGNPNSYINGACGWLKSDYQRECRKRDYTPNRTSNIEGYRLSFTVSYCEEVNARLEEMRSANDEMSSETSGGVIALRSMEEDINALFFSLFPHLDPSVQESRRQEREAKLKAEADADAEFLASLSDAERKRILKEREAEKLRKSRADEKFWRQNRTKYRTVRGDSTGYAAGAAAGREVNLTRSGPAAGAGAKTSLEG